MEYNHLQIDKKWQDRWKADKTYATKDLPTGKKCYVLDMFPYPSGEAMHVGHPKGYVATDVYSRMKRMQGFDVLHPMGWDAFGLPAENYAIKTKTHPKIAIEKNTTRFKGQMEKIGFDYDWDREINTTDPKYYKWTQWIFTKLFEKGLAYESEEPINWCPSCKTGLAYEDLEGGKCERCGSDVLQKRLRQWVLRITDYAERLLSGLNDLDWQPHIKEMQRNWIGKSSGAEVKFKIQDSDLKDLCDLVVFTTRIDTLYGATYVVLAPEHPLVAELQPKIQNWDEVNAYIDLTLKKTNLVREVGEKEKTGVCLKGIFAVNPVNNKEVSVWIADYVLPNYGTGAIMAVPAHDERDFEFAKKFNLPIIQVIADSANVGVLEKPFVDNGVLINSEKHNGFSADDAKIAILIKTGSKEKVTYKLHDWVFSRQLYWGEPFPIIHCEQCGPVAVPEKDLPVVLPDIEKYEPSGTGESPLAAVEEWVNTKCPKCGGAGKRETNTMPQWAGSSWYYLRYLDSHNDTAFVDKEKEKAWMPVDCYVGGVEHATRHLIYARFWHKFLYDLGHVSHDEPFARLESPGTVLAEDGRKMSKRWGNVVNPDDVVARFGADTFRTYEMFMGPFENAISWSTESMIGVRRFLERVAGLDIKVGEYETPLAINQQLNETIAKVGENINDFRFNTAVSALMILSRTLSDEPKISKSVYQKFLKILAPFAPHLAEELWSGSGETTSIHLSSWPAVEEAYLVKDEYEIAVQVNGKVRDMVKISTKLTEIEVLEMAKKSPKIAKWIDNKEIIKTVYVAGKILNIVVKP